MIVRGRPRSHASSKFKTTLTGLAFRLARNAGGSGKRDHTSLVAHFNSPARIKLAARRCCALILARLCAGAQVTSTRSLAERRSLPKRIAAKEVAILTAPRWRELTASAAEGAIASAAAHEAIASAAVGEAIASAAVGGASTVAPCCTTPSVTTTGRVGPALKAAKAGF